MKRMVVMAMSGALLALVSCQKTEMERWEPGEPNKLPVQVSLSTAGIESPSASIQSKSSASSEEGLNVVYGSDEVESKSATELTKDQDSKVYDVWAIQYDASGRLVGKPFYAADGLTMGEGSGAYDATCSVSVNLTPSSDASGKVYFITNTHNGHMFTDQNVATETHLHGVMQGIGSEWKPSVDGGIPMMGVYTGKVEAGKSLGNVPVTRLAAKVILKFKLGGSLASGFTIQSVRLRNVPDAYYFCNAPTGSPVWPAVSGTFIDYPNDLGQAKDDGGYKKLVWYMPENMRGVKTTVKQDKDRTLDKTDGKAAYIEIIGLQNNQEYYRTVTFNILLGDAVTNKGDFNVKRNTAYTATVDLNGVTSSDNRITVAGYDMNNCAIVTPNGGEEDAVTFDIRKLTKGWQKTMPALGASAKLSARLLWADDKSVAQQIKFSLDKVNGLLKVWSAGTAKGNAIIALYNTDATTGGDVLWSWHAWVTEYNPDGKKTYTLGANAKEAVPGGQVHTYGTQFKKTNPGKVIMDRNLGAVKTYYAAPAVGEAATADLAFGMFYQWGRKDPFPRALGTSIDAQTATATTIPIYGANGVKLDDETDGQVAATATSGYRKINITTSGVMKGTNTFEYSVKNPLAFIYNANTPYDWYTTTAENQNNTLWGEGAAKSAYDPCPEGWRVAPNGTWSDFTRDAETPTNGTFPYYSKGKIGETYTAGDYHATNGRLYTALGGPEGADAGVKVWYPAPGYRDCGEKLPLPGNWQHAGWTGNSYGCSTRDSLRADLRFNGTYFYPNHWYFAGHAYSLRCLREFICSKYSSPQPAAGG